MDRRLYFLLPDRQHALDVVEELTRSDIALEHIHAYGDPRTRLVGLPAASTSAQHTGTSLAGKLIRNANLTCFALALLSIPVIAIFQSNWWLLFPVGIMLANLLIGFYFTHVPTTYLGEFTDALAHGEVLLTVDVPETRVQEVDTGVREHHPVAHIDHAGWGHRAFGL